MEILTKAILVSSLALACCASAPFRVCACDNAAAVFTVAARGRTTPVFDEAALVRVATNGWGGDAVSNVVICTPTEAKSAVNGIFSKTDHYGSPQKREVVCRLLDAGAAYLVKFDRIEKTHNGDSERRTIPVTTWCLVRNVMNWGLPCESCDGRIEISTRCSAADTFTFQSDNKVWGHERDIFEEDFTSIFGPSELLAQAQGAPTNTEAVVVVADVESVRLSSLQIWGDASGQIRTCGEVGCGEQHSRAVYRVDLRVRDVRRGTCAFRRFAFPVELDTANVSVTGDWLFFRGMTLEIGFSREGNALKVNRAEPVFPYPPYAKDGICLYTAPSEIPGCSPFCGMLNAVHDIRENAKESRHVSKGLALVQYGDRELAVFASSTNLVTGMCGTYPDYGASVKITVYGDAGSNLDYWRTAWFAEPHEVWIADEDEARYVSDVSIEKIGLADDFGHHNVHSGEKMLFFKWRNTVLPSVEFHPPATIGDVAAFFTVGCSVCAAEKGDIRYAVSADASAVSRAVRPFAATNVSAFAALRRVCAENGCTFRVKGTNVVISAEVGEDMMRPPDLDELTRELAASGFADVSGAVYAAVSPYPAKVDGSLPSCNEMAGMTTARAARFRASGNGWVVPPKSDAGRVKFLAHGCVWYEAQADSVGLSVTDEDGKEKVLQSVSFSKARLARDVVFVRAYAEEMASFADAPPEGELVDLLCFALHARQAGFAAEAERIVSALFACPKNGAVAVKGLKKRLEKVKRDYPDFEAWERKVIQEKALKKKGRSRKARKSKKTRRPKK